MCFVLLAFCFVLTFMANGQPRKPTMEAIEGPYYKPNAPFRNDTTICDHTRVVNGTQLLVRGRVHHSNCVSNQSALLDIWSANPQGEYTPRTGPDFTCRGKLMADSNGYYQFLTTVPGRYKQGNTYRPAHIHFKISPNAQSPVLNILTTQLYFVEDPYIQADPCDHHVCRAGDPTITFPLQPECDKSYLVNFDIYLKH